MPTQLGMSELMVRVKGADGASQSGGSSGSVGIVDAINAVVQAAADQLGRSQRVVEAHANELAVTDGLITQSITQVETNENNRIALVKEYNQGVLGLNQMLVEMTTGSQQINDVISLANRVKNNLATDIHIINDAITVTNDWMVKMDNWVTFVKQETHEIDEAQANLVKWGDATKNNMNLHEVAAIKLAREAYDMETEISDMSNFLLSTGKLMGYAPQTLSMAEAAGGLGWAYSYWS